MLDGARVFHVNVNCRDLARSRAFYVDALGLTESTRTAPATVQPGAAFGLERARWDAWILTGSRGFEAGALDLLEWQEPSPVGGPPASAAEVGYQRIGCMVADLDAALVSVVAHGGTITVPAHDAHVGGGHHVRLAHVTDPDGIRVELVEGRPTGPLFVAVRCADLEASLAWYRTLGFREVGRFENEAAPGEAFGVDGAVRLREVVCALPGSSAMSVILVTLEGLGGGPAAGPRPANAVGIWRTALLVDTLDAKCARLSAAGVRLLSEPVSMAMGEGLPDLRFVCFTGPDGEVLELIETPG